MVASFHAGWGTAAIRLTYTPGDDRQTRTDVALAFTPVDGIPRRHRPNRARRTLRGTHDFSQSDALGTWPLPAGLNCVLRGSLRGRRVGIQNTTGATRNPYIRRSTTRIVPFEPREENPQPPPLARFGSPIRSDNRTAWWRSSSAPLRTCGTATCTTDDTRLMQVNQTGDDLNPETADATGSDRSHRWSRSAIPWPTNLLREQEEVHRKLREAASALCHPLLGRDGG